MKINITASICYDVSSVNDLPVDNTARGPSWA